MAGFALSCKAASAPRASCHGHGQFCPFELLNVSPHLAHTSLEFPGARLRRPAKPHLPNSSGPEVVERGCMSTRRAERNGHKVEQPTNGVGSANSGEGRPPSDDLSMWQEPVFHCMFLDRTMGFTRNCTKWARSPTHTSPIQSLKSASAKQRYPPHGLCLQPLISVEGCPKQV